ncbi:hypothetical protein FJW04_23270 [Mesorhizobium sp. B2-7-3]|nr:hypothetical protein FJW04_23270 [Mesorhizobium sp. B2-7-3]
MESISSFPYPPEQGVSCAMKKTYAKPVLTKRERLSATARTYSSTVTPDRPANGKGLALPPARCLSGGELSY